MAGVHTLACSHLGMPGAEQKRGACYQSSVCVCVCVKPISVCICEETLAWVHGKAWIVNGLAMEHRLMWKRYKPNMCVCACVCVCVCASVCTL